MRGLVTAFPAIFGVIKAKDSAINTSKCPHESQFAPGARLIALQEEKLNAAIAALLDSCANRSMST